MINLCARRCFPIVILSEDRARLTESPKPCSCNLRRTSRTFSQVDGRDLQIDIFSNKFEIVSAGAMSPEAEDEFVLELAVKLFDFGRPT